MIRIPTNRFKCRPSLLGMWLLFVSGHALADPADDQGRADALFDEGMQLMESGQAAAACPKFEQSQKLSPAMGNQFNLADCYARIGRVASAWNHFMQVAEAAHGKGDSLREQKARDRAKELEPRLSRVTLRVSQPSSGLVIDCDGAEIPANQWATPLVVDAGSHVIRVIAPQKIPWSKTIDGLAEGAAIEVEIPALAPVVELKPTTVVNVEPSQQPSKWPHSKQRTWALVSAGAGIVGLGVGSAMVIAAQSKHSTAEKFCDAQNRCSDQQGIDALNAAKSLGDWANLPFGLGIAGLGLGATLWFTDHTARNEQARTSVALSPNGVLVRGSF